MDKVKKKTSLIFVVAMVLIVRFVMPMLPTGFVDEAIEATETPAASAASIVPIRYKYIMPQLTGDEASIYSKLYKAAKEFQTEVVFDASEDKESIIKMVKLLRDNPTLFWVGQGQHILTSPDEYIVVFPYDTYAKEEALNLKNRIEFVTGEALSSGKTNSAEDASKTIAEWLIQNVHYDSSEFAQEDPANSCVVGPLLEGQAICGGYASATCSATSLKR